MLDPVSNGPSSIRLDWAVLAFGYSPILHIVSGYKPNTVALPEGSPKLGPQVD